jgi:hypothetical protein
MQAPRTLAGRCRVSCRHCAFPGMRCCMPQSPVLYPPGDRDGTSCCSLNAPSRASRPSRVERAGPGSSRAAPEQQGSRRHMRSGNVARGSCFRAGAGTGASGDGASRSPGYRPTNKGAVAPPSPPACCVRSAPTSRGCAQRLPRRRGVMRMLDERARRGLPTPEDLPGGRCKFENPLPCPEDLARAEE